MIIPLHAGNPSVMTGSGNWTYLLSGRTPALIDAGVGNAPHIDAIAAQLPDGPAHVIVTHAHSDHASGAPALAARFPRARFFKLPWPDRDARYEVAWQSVTDGDTIAAGDDAVRVIHTPGHAPDHICLWLERPRTVFSGDLLVLGSTVVIPPSAGGSLAEYLESLRRLQALGATCALPAHGPAIDDPDALIRSYLDHRAQRERQVIAALEEGCRTIEAMANRIYVGIANALMPMARENVLAHLQKLASERRVKQSGDEWTLV